MTGLIHIRPAPSICAAGMLASALLMAAPASADWVTTTEPVRAGVVLERAHLRLERTNAPAGALERIEDALGLEARVSLYPGRPLSQSQLGPPTLVRRNDVITLVVRINGLTLQTEGRALGNGGLGERIQVMNLDSRRTVYGTVAGPKTVEMR